jgi:hypothetical protein
MASDISIHHAQSGGSDNLELALGSFAVMDLCAVLYNIIVFGSCVGGLKFTEYEYF